MARIIVTADHTAPQGAAVLLDEGVASVHLSSDHAARALIERLSWALADAEALEHAGRNPDRTAPARARVKETSVFAAGRLSQDAA